MPGAGGGVAELLSRAHCLRRVSERYTALRENLRLRAILTRNRVRAKTSYDSVDLTESE